MKRLLAIVLMLAVSFACLPALGGGGFSIYPGYTVSPYPSVTPGTDGIGGSGSVGGAGGNGFVLIYY